VVVEVVELGLLVVQLWDLVEVLVEMV